MKTILNNKDRERLNKLIETKDFNMTTAELLNDLCCIRDDSLKDEYFNLGWKKYNNDALMSWAIHLLNIDYSLKENQNFFKRFLASSFVFEDSKKYVDNPYKEQIKPFKTNKNQYSFSYEKYPAYSFFPLEDIAVIDDDYYREETKVGIFENEFDFLTLFENNEIWMCITPNEMNTMKTAINNANGHVITLGLGLGYFAFMASKKKNVTKVTVIENNDVIINLFVTYILPLFQNKDKIEIINSNALDQIELINKCDYCFCDLWHDANDGLPIYINLKKAISIPSDYWIEESLIALYRRCLITVIEESLQNKHDNDYKYAYNPTDKIINQIYFKTKNVEFYDYESIHEFCSKDNILKLLSE